MSRVIEMRDSIAHRGPDDAGVWQSPSAIATLGSRRLAILDLSPSGHQPMVEAESGLAITFNGEIYNYLELADELSSLGFRFRSRTDTEVLLKAYEAWREECLPRLNGMFAFAIWDERKQELFAARDRFGEKPFYYYQDPAGELFAFGSEIKALLAGRFAPARFDRAGVYSFLHNDGLDSGSGTMFENIYSLPAAHALHFSPRTRRLKIWRYWDLNPQHRFRYASDGEYAERFFEVMSDSVRVRLRSDVPVGSSLSGGLDSSTIVGLVARARPMGGQQTFSARFHDPAFDEGNYISEMVSWSGVENHSVYPDSQKLPSEIEKLTWHQDAPFCSSSIYAQWCVMRLARENGVTVLLDGQGGDEVLAGYHSYFGGYFLDLLKQRKFAAGFDALRQYVGTHGRTSLPLIFLNLLPSANRLWVKGFLRPRGVSKAFAHSERGAPRPPSVPFQSSLHQSMYDTLTRTSLPALLRYADRNSMAFSREVRLPFLDHRLVEYLFAIPPDQKIHTATTKILLRSAMRGIIPEGIRNRKDKIGFAPPESVWLQGPLREWAEDTFSSAQFREREWLDARVLQRAWMKFKNGDAGLQGVVWRWLSLETWAKACLKARPFTVQPASFRLQSATSAYVQ
jgi:asparagine synthase (glutamine-hydrolysing)